MLFKRKWVNRCPLLEIANNVTFLCICVWWSGTGWLSFYLHTGRLLQLSSPGPHDKLQISKVIYMQYLIYSVFASVRVWVCIFVRGHVWKVCVCVCCKMKSTFFHLFFPWVCDHEDGCQALWVERRGEDFCCMLPPSHCPISSSPGRQSPAIWRDRPRLAHKSRPPGPWNGCDIITLRHGVLCSSLLEHMKEL